MSPPTSPTSTDATATKRKTLATPIKVDAENDPVQDFVLSLQQPPDHKAFDMLCPDGVWRVVHFLPGPDEEPSQYEIYDAKPMTPELIKMFLDRWPWTQEKEDKYRGVDGRIVPQEQWLNPPDGVVPPQGTRQDRRARFEKARDEEKKLREEGGEEVLGPGFGFVQSDYDLSPR